MLFPVGDVATLASALERLLGDKSLANKLGRAGQERVKREFRVGSCCPWFLRAKELEIWWGDRMNRTVESKVNDSWTSWAHDSAIES
jgi:glycosyltransferase involved in cell wall biosynthesis